MSLSRIAAIASGAIWLSSCAAPATTADAPLVLALERYHDKLFTVRAQIGGVERSFLFDTGEGVTMIAPALAQAIGCEPWGNIAGFRMLGERLDLQRCDDVTFVLAGRSFTAPSTIATTWPRSPGASRRCSMVRSGSTCSPVRSSRCSCRHVE